jgi:radical SAM/Cys-rich protein
MIMRSAWPELDAIPFPALTRGRLETLQVNLGYKCNQTCLHCHVNAGPNRIEMMDGETLALIPRAIAARGVTTLDITGGAPELHPGFRDLVREVRAMGVTVIDRCNLTILTEPGHEDLAEFLGRQRVQIVASMPCYLEDNVDAQRGEGVFARSITGLKRLNALGYGRAGTGLTLDLVFNPQGPSLPPDQIKLEIDYKRMLGERHGVVFNHLLALANMPIQRFGATLLKRGQLAPYMDLLQSAHRDDNLEGVMCRSLVSVDWRGFLHDCDFNQMLELPMGGDTSRPHLRDLLKVDIAGRPIRVAGHCFGCTAGQGSSCGGALAAE